MNTAESATAAPDLDRLFRESAVDLERYFLRRHGSSEEARDLVQEVFLQLAKSQARPQGSVRGYLFGIARNLSAGWWRKHFHLPRLESIEDHPDATADANSPADARLEQAREILAKLPPRDREILEFRLGLGLSYAETADALGIPIGTVRSRLHHAIAELRERLAKENHPT
ncbi:MAG: RNA polymerase sigma factor [Verrucomicrobiales bacterium]